MFSYHPGKFRAFLKKRDWNQLFQELGTIIIGIGLGLYFYETKTGFLGNDVPGSSLFTTSSRPYLVFGMVCIAIAILVKASIYLSILDANSLKRSKLKSKRGGIDIDGIIQEFLTICLGIAIGMFTTPVVKNAFVFETSEYPNPIPGVILTLVCIIAKICLYAEAISFRRGRKSFWQSGKIQPFLAQYDWNEVFQEISSTCVGVAMGLYAYESKIVLLPEKMFPGLFGQAEDRVGGILDGFDNVLQRHTSLSFVDFTPSFLSNKDAQPYVIAGIILLVACIVFKYLIYAGKWDANNLRKKMVGGKGGRPRRGIDYHGIVDEIVTFLLTMVVGIITTPIVKNAFTQQKEEYNQQMLYIILLIILTLLKVGLATGALQVKRARKRKR